VFAKYGVVDVGVDILRVDERAVYIEDARSNRLVCWHHVSLSAILIDVLTMHIRSTEVTPLRCTYFRPRLHTNRVRTRLITHTNLHLAGTTPGQSISKAAPSHYHRSPTLKECYTCEAITSQTEHIANARHVANQRCLSWPRRLRRGEKCSRLGIYPLCYPLCALCMHLFPRYTVFYWRKILPLRGRHVLCYRAHRGGLRSPG
jgi:hypothetical protein